MISPSPTSTVQTHVLDRFVARIDVVKPRPGEPHRVVDHLPDGTSCLVFRALGGGAGDASVRGPWTRAHYKLAPSIPLTAEFREFARASPAALVAGGMPTSNSRVEWAPPRGGSH